MLYHLVGPFIGTAPRRRLALGLLAVAVPLLVYLPLGMSWPQAVIAMLPTVYGEILLFRFFRRWMAVRRRFVRWEMRLVRSWRAQARPNPFIDVLHYLALAIVFLSVACMAGGWIAHGLAGIDAAIAVLAIAGLCDTVVLVSRIVRSSWAPTLGKVLSISVCVILLAISLSMAKQATHGLAQIDPKYLTEFVAVLTFLFIPVVYLHAAAAVLMVWATGQLLVLSVLAFGDMLLGQPLLLFASGWKKRLELRWYRLVHGHKPPGGVVPKAGMLPQAHITLVASPLSKLAVVVVLSPLMQDPVEALPSLKPAMASALVEMEYRSGSRCKDIGAAAKVAYMENGWVSVARGEKGNHVFDVVQCEFTRP